MPTSTRSIVSTLTSKWTSILCAKTKTFLKNSLETRYTIDLMTERLPHEQWKISCAKFVLKEWWRFIHCSFPQTIKGKTIDQRYEDFAKAWDKGKEYFKDKPFAIVFPRNDTPKTTKNESLWFLGGLLQTIADVDVVVFVGDWNRSRDCLVEHDCCVRFGIPILYA